MVRIKEDIKNNIQKVDDLKKEIEVFIIKFQIPSRELMKAEKLSRNFLDKIINCFFIPYAGLIQNNILKN